MTPPQQFRNYKTRALDAIAASRSLLHQHGRQPDCARLHELLERAAHRLREYSAASEAATRPNDATAQAQAEGYRRSLELALREIVRLLNNACADHPEPHCAIQQAAELLFTLYRNPVPAFPERLARMELHLEIRTLTVDL